MLTVVKAYCLASEYIPIMGSKAAIPSVHIRWHGKSRRALLSEQRVTVPSSRAHVCQLARRLAY